MKLNFRFNASLEINDLSIEGINHIDRSGHSDNDQDKIHKRDHSNETTLDKISGSASAKIDMDLGLDVTEKEMEMYSNLIQGIANKYLEKSKEISDEIKSTSDKINTFNRKVEKTVDEKISGSNTAEEFKSRAAEILGRKMPATKEELNKGIDDIRKTMKLYENNKELEPYKGYYFDLQGELYNYVSELTKNRRN